MEQRGRDQALVDPVLQTAQQALQAPLARGGQQPGAARQPDLEAQALLAQEGQPARPPAVGLGRRADVVVAVEAIGVGAAAVQRGQGAPERLGGLVKAGPGGRLQPLQQDEAGARVLLVAAGQHARDAHGRGGLQQRQAVGLGAVEAGPAAHTVLEQVGRAGGLKPQRAADAAAAQRALAAQAARVAGQPQRLGDQRGLGAHTAGAPARPCSATIRVSSARQAASTSV